MLVSPLPGASRATVYEVLRQLQIRASNLQAGPVEGGSYRWLVDYLTWVTEAVRVLSSQISTTDINRLVLTRRYELLLSMIAGVSPQTDSTVLGYRSLGALPVMATRPSPHPVVNDLLSTELQERVAIFDEAVKALGQQIERWSRPGVFIGMDTGVYINHPEKLENIDFAKLIDVRGDDIHILVPMLVVEELDGLKQHGTAGWRAAYSLAVLDKVLPEPTVPARLRVADLTALESGGIPRGEISVELLFDTPGHVRLPINDDEIIKRLLTAQSLAGRPITLVTYDTNQAFRARAAGLHAIRLKMPIESKPEPEPSAKAQRKQRDRAPDTTGRNNGENRVDTA